VKDLYPGLDLVLDARNRYESPWYLEQTGDTADLHEVRLAVDTMARADWSEEGVRLSEEFAALTFPYPALVRRGKAVAVFVGYRWITPYCHGSFLGAASLAAGESATVELRWGTYLGVRPGTAVMPGVGSIGQWDRRGGSTSLNIPAPGGYRQPCRVWTTSMSRSSRLGDTLLWGTYLGGSDTIPPTPRSGFPGEHYRGG